MDLLRRHPRAADALLAAALTILVAQEVLWADIGVDRATAFVTVVLPTIALAWRRTAPLVSAAVVAGGAAVLGLPVEGSAVPQTPLVTLAVAAYSAGAYAPQIRGLLFVLAGVLVGEAEDAIVQVPLFTAIWSGGRLALRYREQARELADLNRALERERADHARMAIAEERTRIARELHDVVAHGVSTMVVQAGAERLALGGERPQTAAVLAEVERTGREALSEMRRLLGVLRDHDEQAALAPQPTLAELDALVERTTRSGLRVDLRIEGRPVRLAPGLDLSAYRIVQEALTNALRHSGAGRAEVVVRYAADALEIEVNDDGRAGAPGPAGHGLTGMRERAALYGGEIDAGVAQEGGWALRARLPIRAAT